LGNDYKSQVNLINYNSFVVNEKSGISNKNIHLSLINTKPIIKNIKKINLKEKIEQIVKKNK